jgi:tetratricopeptide (TPR) repeat protein
MKRWQKEIAKETLTNGLSNSPSASSLTSAIPSMEPCWNTLNASNLDQLYDPNPTTAISYIFGGCHWPVSSVSYDSILSRLFATLKMQPQANVQTIFLDPSANTVFKKSACKYLSKEDMLDLVSGQSWRNENLEQNPGSNSVRSPIYPSATETKGSSNGLRFSGLDILFPSEILVTPDPSQELYIFPIPSSSWTNERKRFPPLPRFISYQTEKREYKDRYMKLSAMLPHTHPAVIRTMEKLGSAYYHLGNAHLAEHWYQYVVSARDQTEKLISLETLDAWLGLIDAITAQGRYVEGKILHQEIHPSIVRMVPAHHWLMQKSLQTIAIISGNLGIHEDAEHYYRQLVQIRLSALGPRHGDTLAAMQRLANPLRRQEQYAESEELLAITVQLSESSPGMSEQRKCRGLSSLAKVLFDQGRYNESEMLHRASAERSKLSLGDEDPTTLQCLYHLARSLRAQGLLEEAKRILHSTIEIQTRVLGEGSPSTIESMSELAKTLEMGKNYEGAATWYTKALKGNEEVWGPDSDNTLIACEILGRCYELQGLYSDALALYIEAMNEVLTAKGINKPNEEAIAEIQGWIDRLCALPLEHTLV